LRKVIPLEKIPNVSNKNGLKFRVIIWPKWEAIPAKRVKKMATLFVDEPIPVTAQSKAWVYVHSFAGIIGSNPLGGMDVCLLLGKGLCDGWALVQRNPTKCGVSECDHESSTMRRLWPTRGCRATKL
jgi:hypothetical protein